MLIDLQNDFVEGGALAVQGGLDVVEVANRLIPKFDWVVATQDWHPADHQCFASQNPDRAIGDQFLLGGVPQTVWPDHCIAGTHGSEFVAGLNCSDINHVIRKGTQKEVDSYSGFFDNARGHSTGLTEHLRKQDVAHIYAMGLATDYCVKASVLDAIAEGFQVTLILDGCRGVELQIGDVENAVNEMKGAGAEIISTSEVI